MGFYRNVHIFSIFRCFFWPGWFHIEKKKKGKNKNGLRKTIENSRHVLLAVFTLFSKSLLSFLSFWMLSFFFLCFFYFFVLIYPSLKSKKIAENVLKQQRIPNSHSTKSYVNLFWQFGWFNMALNDNCHAIDCQRILQLFRFACARIYLRCMCAIAVCFQSTYRRYYPQKIWENNTIIQFFFYSSKSTAKL